GRAGVFYRYGFEIIDWVRLAEEEVWFSRNLTKLQTVGAEVNLYYRPNIPYLHRVGFHYTYTHVSKNESKYISLYATDYLRNAFIFSLDHAIYKSLGASWELCVNDRAGTYVNTQGKETSYKPYVLCNLKLYWSCPRFEIYVMASNLFNSKYFDLGNIPQAGIWAKAGASVRFGPQARCKPKN
ncbi:MAG: TonB-dependent receptor, partial [Bacteroidales bacterium]